MSIQQVRLMVELLPRTLGEQVVGYAESVDRALPDIFRETGRAYKKAVADQIVYLAGIKKLEWLVSSSYWTLENSGKLLQEIDVNRIRIGGADVSRGGKVYGQLQSLLKELERVLSEKGVAERIRKSWPDLIRELSGDGRQRNK